MVPLALLIPLTFEFFGTWGVALPGAPVRQGDPISGSFTFERLEDGVVTGQMQFSLPGMTLEPFFLVESPDGFGLMAVQSLEPACRTSLGDVPCAVTLFLGGPTANRGGDGTRNHSLALSGNGGNWGIGLARSSDIRVDPYLPFAIRETYFIPEPGTVALVGLGLLVLLRRLRHGVPAVVNSPMASLRHGPPHTR
jgi:hypothetical protein